MFNNNCSNQFNEIAMDPQTKRYGCPRCKFQSDDFNECMDHMEGCESSAMKMPRFRIFTTKLSGGKIINHFFPSKGVDEECLVELYSKKQGNETKLVPARKFLQNIYGPWPPIVIPNNEAYKSR